jgi:hypothetical protein
MFACNIGIKYDSNYHKCLKLFPYYTFVKTISMESAKLAILRKSGNDRENCKQRRKKYTEEICLSFLKVFLVV